MGAAATSEAKRLQAEVEALKRQRGGLRMRIERLREKASRGDTRAAQQSVEVASMLTRLNQRIDDYEVFLRNKLSILRSRHNVKPIGSLNRSLSPGPVASRRPKPRRYRARSNSTGDVSALRSFQQSFRVQKLNKAVDNSDAKAKPTGASTFSSLFPVRSTGHRKSKSALAAPRTMAVTDALFEALQTNDSLASVLSIPSAPPLPPNVDKNAIADGESNEETLPPPPVVDVRCSDRDSSFVMPPPPIDEEKHDMQIGDANTEPSIIKTHRQVVTTSAEVISTGTSSPRKESVTMKPGASDSKTVKTVSAPLPFPQSESVLVKTDLPHAATTPYPTTTDKSPKSTRKKRKKKWDNVGCDGEVLFDFEASGPKQVSVHREEVVYVISRRKGWFRGKTEAGVVGVFPVTYVRLKPPRVVRHAPGSVDFWAVKSKSVDCKDFHTEQNDKPKTVKLSLTKALKDPHPPSMEQIIASLGPKREDSAGNAERAPVLVSTPETKAEQKSIAVHEGVPPPPAPDKSKTVEPSDSKNKPTHVVLGPQTIPDKSQNVLSQPTEAKSNVKPSTEAKIEAKTGDGKESADAEQPGGDSIEDLTLTGIVDQHAVETAAQVPPSPPPPMSTSSLFSTHTSVTSEDETSTKARPEPTSPPCVPRSPPMLHRHGGPRVPMPPRGFSQTPPPAGSLRIGMQVVYYSRSFGGWVYANVIKTRHDVSAVDLDIKPYAPMHLIRVLSSTDGSRRQGAPRVLTPSSQQNHHPHHKATGTQLHGGLFPFHTAALAVPSRGGHSRARSQPRASLGVTRRTRVRSSSAEAAPRSRVTTASPFIKVSFGDEIRKVQVPSNVSVHEDLLKTLWARVVGAFPGIREHRSRSRLRYTDEDGDMVTLSSNRELRTLLQGGQVVRFTLVVAKSPVSLLPMVGSDVKQRPAAYPDANMLGTPNPRKGSLSSKISSGADSLASFSTFSSDIQMQQHGGPQGGSSSGVTRAMATSPSDAATGVIVRKGWLQKRGGIGNKGALKRRFFRVTQTRGLQKHYLLLYTASDRQHDLKKPNAFLLEGAMVTAEQKAKYFKVHIRGGPSRTLLLKAKSRFERDEWVSHLRSLASKPGVFIGHTGSVQSVCFSLDGKMLASGSTDGSVKVWEASSTALLSSFQGGHTGSVYCVRFVPGGSHVISASADKTICLWSLDATTETARTKGGGVRQGAQLAVPGLIAVYRSHTADVTGVDVFKTLSLFVSSSSDKSLKLWPLTRRQQGPAAKSSQGPSARGHAHVVSQPLATLTGHNAPVRSVALSPDQTHVASASVDGSIRLWRLVRASARCVATLCGHKDSVNSVNFSPNGRLIVSASDDKSVRVWGLAPAALIHTLSGHAGWVYEAIFSRSGQFIFSGGEDEAVRVWSTVSGSCVAVLSQPTAPICCLAVPIKTTAKGQTNCVVVGLSNNHIITLDTKEWA